MDTVGHQQFILQSFKFNKWCVLYLLLQNFNTSSPIKGLERLSEDLRQERQKATMALQDRARLRIEVESLKTQYQQVTADMKEYKGNMENLEIHRDSLQRECAELRASNKKFETELFDTRASLQHLEATYQDTINNHE